VNEIACLREHHVESRVTTSMSDGARLADRALSLIALLLLALPFAAAALFVLATLGRPILFSQRRAGRGGVPFTIKKLRTMRELRDEKGELLPDRLRETAATRLLRRTRLDEVPQLLSILSGEMAFIGPRPLLPATIESMGELGVRRCSVRPGLTGWAQVNGNTRLANDQKLALDIWYVDNRSLWLDCLILAKTVATIIRGERLDEVNLARAQAHLATFAGARRP
jgi:lipopolysaccharide/colanic/teichoic acid biosynthesis glycosyltransferase